MISVYEGKLGGGKSYHACLRILEYLARGGHVYTNIELVPDKCVEFCRFKWGVEIQPSEQIHILDPRKISELHMFCVGGTSEAPTLVVVDELHLYHNARDWASASRPLLAWLTQSRKLYVDIIFITQHRNNVDKQWIRLTAGFHAFRDMRKWVVPGFGFRWPFPHLLEIVFDQDGRTVVQRNWNVIDKRVFQCYSSNQLFGGVGNNAGSGLKKLTLAKSKPKWSKKMRFLLVFAVVSLCFSVYKGRSLWRRFHPEKNQPVSAVVSSPSSPVSVASVDYPPMPPVPVDDPLVEVEPTFICYDFSGDIPVFEYAVVNSRRTHQRPSVNRRGDLVYYCRASDLDEDPFERHRRFREENPVRRPSSQSTNSTPRKPRSWDNDNWSPPMAPNINIDS